MLYNGSMKMKTLTDAEFNQMVTVSRTTLDPDFLEFLKLLDVERRLFVSNLTRSQQAFLYRKYKSKVRVLSNGNGKLVFLTE